MRDRGLGPTSTSASASCVSTLMKPATSSSMQTLRQVTPSLVSVRALAWRRAMAIQDLSVMLLPGLTDPDEGPVSDVIGARGLLLTQQQRLLCV